MEDLETTLLIQEIMDKAVNGEAQSFTYILTWREFRYYKRLRLSTKLVIRTLKASANNLFKEYCNEVSTGAADVTKLFAYCQLLDMTDFYENELSTIQLMLDDYDEYLGNFGNFVKALLGEKRNEL